MEIVQYILVRSDLKMGKGKMVAQGSHASVNSCLNAIYRKDEIYDANLSEVLYTKINRTYQAENQHVYWKSWFDEWISTLYKKIVVKVDSESELFDFALQSYNAGFPMFLVKDAGLTQIDPNTYTALGFLCPKEQCEISIPKIKTLKLL